MGLVVLHAASRRRDPHRHAAGRRPGEARRHDAARPSSASARCRSRSHKRKGPGFRPAPRCLCNRSNPDYCFFFSGSGVAGDEAPLGVERSRRPRTSPSCWGCWAARPRSWSSNRCCSGCSARPRSAPPEAEPDFGASLRARPAHSGGRAAGRSRCARAGRGASRRRRRRVWATLDEVGEVLLGLSPRSHAARPKASATATARVESFMRPPWVGVQKNKAANCGPGLTP